METIRYDDMETYDWDGNSLQGYQPTCGYEDIYKLINGEEDSNEYFSNKIINAIGIPKEFLQ